MSIQVTVTEYDIKDIAKKIGIELSTQEATVVLYETEQRLNRDYREGRVRILQETVFKVLRKEP